MNPGHLFLTAAIATLLTATGGEAQIEIRVVPDALDPADSLTVGDPFWTTVLTRGPAGYALLPGSIADAYGELEEMAVLDTDRRDGRLRLRLSVFRPGRVVLPAVDARILTDRGDTIAVPVLSDTIPVASVLAPGDTLLADIKPLWTRGGTPAWVWFALAALALAALLVLLWWRRRREPGTTARTAAPNPYRIARERLEALRREPAGPRQRRDAAVAVGEALREYLADAWGLPSRERTTFELLADPPDGIREERAALGSVFAVVDRVKYARVTPEPGEVPPLADRSLAALERLEGRRGTVAEGGETATREAS